MQEKKDKILLVAQSFFGRYGLNKTTVDEIAKKAHVAKGTVYNYFKSKEEIFSEVVKRESNILINKIEKKIEETDSVKEKLRVFFTTRFSYMKELANLYNVSIQVVDELLPQLENERKRFFLREQKIIENILKMGIKEGIFLIKNVSLTSYVMIMAMKGLEFPMILGENNLNIENNIDSLLDILFYGIEIK